jgi:solute carrier family 25 iron transporter 28/37
MWIKMDEDFLDWEANADNIPFKKHMFAGSIAGCVEHLVMFPVDTVKTHL